MKHLLTIALMIFCSLATQAQEGDFSVSVDKNPVSVNDRLKLTMTLLNVRGNISMPQLDGLQVVQGPFSSSNYTFRNGKATTEISQTYVLMAPDVGEYTIGPATAHTSNGPLKSEPITIKVVKGASSSTEGKKQKSSGQNRDLFVNVLLNKSTVYKGEEVIATYKLYSRYESIELSTYEMPVLNGFWSEEVDLGNNSWEPKLETINGLRYRVAILNKQVLYPQRSGELAIEPVQIEAVVNRTFFSRGTKVDITSLPVKLKVKELPGAAPANFSGAVGSLDMRVKADKTELKENDAVNLTITLSGRNNLKLLEAPILDMAQDLETYDPKVLDRIKVNGSGMSGSRTFEYLIIPRHAGKHEVGPFSISYFDTQSGSYKELHSPTIELNVSKGNGSTGGATYSRVNKEEVQVLDEDIRYIRSTPLKLNRPNSGIFGSPLYIGGLLAPALAFVLFLFVRKRRGELYADQAAVRMRLADKEARKKLRAAERSLKGNDQFGVYTHVEQALMEFLGDKFNMPLVERTVENILECLNEQGVETSLVQQTNEALTACQLARYAPTSNEDAHHMYERAVQLIKDLGQAIKQ